MPVAPVAIVGVRFLNARPLLAGLEAAIPYPVPYTFATAEPASCAEFLAKGEAQVSLVPVASLATLNEVKAHSHFGVVADRETTSVLLISKVPWPEIRVLAAHTASKTSVVLARLLLLAKGGAKPKVVPAAPPVEKMLQQADAAVIIGDSALTCPVIPGVTRWDLAAEWMRWQGLPFVFAVWGLRPGVDAGIGQLLGASLAYARAHWEQLLPVWASQHGMEVERTREYLEHRLRYQLGEEERRAVEEFLRLSQEYGLLPSRQGIWLDD